MIGNYGVAGYQRGGGLPDVLAELAEDLELEYVDPLEEINAVDPRCPADFVPLDGHPLGRIYAAMAKAIDEKLELPD